MPRTLRNYLPLLLLLWAEPAWAEEGRIPIYDPVVITNMSGKFVVTRNITAAATKAIEINGTGVEEIEIDLNGFTVKSTADTTIHINNVRSAVVRDGSVICASANPVIIIVAAGSAGQAVLEDLKISGGTVGVWLNPVANFLIRRNFISDTTDPGLLISTPIYTSKGVVEDNQFRNVDDAAIYTASPSNSIESLVIRNNAMGSNHNGMQVSGARGLLVASNDVAITGVGTGIEITGSNTCTVTGNHVTGNPGSRHGIHLSPGQHCLIADNITTTNGRNGIWLEMSDDNRLERNVANGNAESGIRVGGLRNVLERNTTHGNLQFGIRLDAGSGLTGYGRNSTVGNGAGPPPPACANGPGNCGTPNLCDDGAANISYGDNRAPGPPLC